LSRNKDKIVTKLDCEAGLIESITGIKFLLCRFRRHLKRSDKAISVSQLHESTKVTEQNVLIFMHI